MIKNDRKRLNEIRDSMVDVHNSFGDSKERAIKLSDESFILSIVDKLETRIEKAESCIEIIIEYSISDTLTGFATAALESLRGQNE